MKIPLAPAATCIARCTANGRLNGVLLILVILLSSAGCAPDHPETIATQSHSDGSPTVLIVGSDIITRTDLRDEMDALPGWLSSRYTTLPQKLTYAEAVLRRGLVSRDGIRKGYDTRPLAQYQFQRNLLKEVLDSQTRAPAIDWPDRVAYLETAEGKNTYDKRKIYLLEVASKTLADKLTSQLNQAPPSGRPDLFKTLATTYSMDATTSDKHGLLGTATRVELNWREDRTKAESWWPTFGTTSQEVSTEAEEFANLLDAYLGLGPKEIVVRDGSNHPGADSLRAARETVRNALATGEPGTVLGPVRGDQGMWQVLLLGSWESAARLARDKSDDLDLDAIDASIMHLRQQAALVKLIQDADH